MSESLRVAFAGTPGFAVPALDALLESRHTVVSVHTQPDRRSGRGRRVTASPVKQRAMAAGVPVFQPHSLKDSTAQAQLRAQMPDVFVVIAYGQILPPAVLGIPRLGCVNIHASLLPRWRGAAPIQRALLAGDSQTGVSIMQMDSGLDTGPILDRKATAIRADDTAPSLHDRLARLGAEALGPVLDQGAGGAIHAEPQSTADVTYADKLTKAEARIDWTWSARVIERRIRALQPWPVAEARLDDVQLRLWRAQAVAGNTGAAPGTIAASNDGFDVATGEGVLRVLSVQRAGRKRMDAAAFARGSALTGKVLS